MAFGVSYFGSWMCRHNTLSVFKEMFKRDIRGFLRRSTKVSKIKSSSSSYKSRTPLLRFCSALFVYLKKANT